MTKTRKLLSLLLTVLVFTVSISATTFVVGSPETPEDEPEYYMGIMILESQQQKILDSINKVEELQLGNIIILHPLDQAWNLTLIEEAISKANSLGLYTLFEPYNASDHKIRITPEQFGIWKTKYPYLLGIVVSEITGKQVDGEVWLNNSTGTITSRVQAEQAIIKNITENMQLEEFKANGAKILLQENVIGYTSANTSYCDVFISKVFNAPNVELMIGLARGMKNSYNIPAWGLWVDTWREWVKPPAFSAESVERALNEGLMYGAKYFFFEQGCFFGTLDRDWPVKHIILDAEGKLTEYGLVLQKFYAKLKSSGSSSEIEENGSHVAVMLGQSGWSSRGPDWGLWWQSDRQGDYDFRLLNVFFPGIGDNWQIGSALFSKEFTDLPYGMVDIVSIYAPCSALKKYDIVVGLGWSLMTDQIAANIQNYVQDGGIFFSFLTFTHANEAIDDLEDPEAWNKTLESIFGVHVSTPDESGMEIRADDFLYNITFTQNTFWYPWNGINYIYLNSTEDENYIWRFKYTIYPSDDTRVIARTNGNEHWPNDFIIENRNGKGYTYIVNTRNPSSFPDGVLTDFITDFLSLLCSQEIERITLEFDTTELGVTKVRVYPASAMGVAVNADILVNGKLCNETGYGTYEVELPEWLPIQSYSVEVDAPLFGQAEKTALNLHILNTIVVAVGAAVCLIIVWLWKKRKLRRAGSFGLIVPMFCKQ